jgi:hypothetical protein
MQMGRQPANLKSIFRRVIAGVDWGWSSPGAIVVYGDLGSEFVALDESYASHRRIYSPNQGADETWVGEARRLKDLWGIQQFFCDPARPDAIFDFTSAGLHATGAQNDILYGVRKMQEVMHPVNGKPKLTILSHCKELIREVKTYEWAAAKSEGDFSEMPAGGQSDHAIDASRYGIVELTRYATEGASKPNTTQAGRPRF